MRSRGVTASWTAERGILAGTALAAAFVSCAPRWASPDEGARLLDTSSSTAWSTDLAAGGASGWQASVAEDVILATGYRVDPNAIEVAEPTLEVLRLDDETGHALWSTGVEGSAGLVMAILPGTARSLVVTRRQAIAFDTRTGDLAWDSGDLGIDVARAEIVDDELIVVATDGWIVLLSSRSGEETARVDARGLGYIGAGRTGDRPIAVVGRHPPSSDAQTIAAIPLHRSGLPTPLWEESYLTVSGPAQVLGSSVFGRIGGYDWVQVDIGSGRIRRTSEGAPADCAWVRGLCLVPVHQFGMLVRMWQVSAWRLGDAGVPLWTTWFDGSADAILFLPNESKANSLTAEADGAAFRIDAISGRVDLRSTDPPGDPDLTCETAGWSSQARILLCQSDTGATIRASGVRGPAR